MKAENLFPFLPTATTPDLMDLTFLRQFLRHDKPTDYETIDSQMIKSLLKVCILLSVLQLNWMPVSAHQASKEIAKKTGDNPATSTLQYQRWGYFGFYHVGIKVSMKTNIPAQRIQLQQRGTSTAQATHRMS